MGIRLFKMNLENLKKAKEQINLELSNSLKLHNTKEYSLLCEIINSLKILINRLENPNQAKKLDKLCNG